MKALGLDRDEFSARFVEVDGDKHLLVEASPDGVEAWAERLGVPVRRCYLTDEHLQTRIAAGFVGSDVVAAYAPSPGATRSGDFGEILASLYLAAKHPREVLDPIKWRFKNDRDQAAPKADIVQLDLPSWPTPTPDDTVMCAEVKAKATSSPSTPIASALDGAKKDKDGRLDLTLNWLKDIAIREGLETIQVDHLNRFIRPADHGDYLAEHKAIAVISAEFIGEQTATIPDVPDGISLIVISFPELYDTYTATFEAMVAVADHELSAAGGVAVP